VLLTPDALSRATCVLITTDHSSIDWDFVVRNARVVLDTRNATHHVEAGREKIVLI
jgi:UDP-N-acetyl-D-glucosamine dehydrogenase